MEFSSEQQVLFEKIIEAFLRENAVTNLSAIRTPEGVSEKHIRDSLAAEMFLTGLDADSKILDIGTGGGFPLLPLAAVFPEYQFFGLDSVGKKLAAIERITQATRIKNVTLLNGRLEEFGRRPEHREQYDIVTARAVAPFSVLVELASPFAKIGGNFLAYRGPDSDADDILLAAKLNLKFVQKVDYSLAEGEQRTLWIFEKTVALSKKFPREVGIPKKKPLTLHFFQKQN